MKKIINGKLYNTDTAKALGSYDNGLGDGDFYHFNETLYLKKTGEFFLYGFGGPMTYYAESIGDGNWRSGGEKIFPQTEAEAKKWVEDHLDADTYIEIFGEVEE